ncbi:MAG: Hsp20 family protein [Rhodobiaceae bacterium]|nr:Hsp20 family protein [Rhodobiaceae bacterium]
MMVRGGVVGCSMTRTFRTPVALMSGFADATDAKRTKGGFAVSRTINLNSPFLLGFDEIDSLLEHIGRSASNGYPPYNIERLAADADKPERLRITLAVAGFRAEDLDVTVADGQLTIRGRQNGGPDRDFLYRGIAARQFQRCFVLAETMEVGGAVLENGLLAITLVRPQPLRGARRIRIAAGD